MRWSFEELFRAIGIYRQKSWRMKLKMFPYYVIRIIKIVFHWLFKGYCKETQFSLDYELLYIIRLRLKLFKKQNVNSHPSTFNSIEDWHAELQNMINKLDYLISTLDDTNEQVSDFKIVYAVFMEKFENNFLNLWD